MATGAFKDDVLAVDVLEGSVEGGFTKTVDVNGEKVTLTILKNSSKN